MRYQYDDIKVGFNTTVDRFNNKGIFFGIKTDFNPGPGNYNITRPFTVKAKGNSKVFNTGVEKFNPGNGSYIKTQPTSAGPGSYLSNETTMIKRTFRKWEYEDRIFKQVTN